MRAGVFCGIISASAMKEEYRMHTKLLHTACTDPRRNLALEEYILDRAVCPVLYLWQNANTVVIGRHQNPWAECDLSLLESTGGRLVRRLSGGGAVYHDLGNLNFTFIMPRDIYDVSRQTRVLLEAVRACGINAEPTGRNDLCAGGRKFSGNAFCFRERTAYHHGTLLLNADVERMTALLTVDPEKLKSKAVASVRSRVVNLTELAPGLTAGVLAESLSQAFRNEYGETEEIYEDSFDPSVIEALTEKYASWEWTYSSTPRFDSRFAGRFSWGSAEILLTLRDGSVSECRMYSDSLDETLPDAVSAVLSGLPYRADAFRLALEQAALRMPAHSPAMSDLAGWLGEAVR